MAILGEEFAHRDLALLAGHALRGGDGSRRLCSARFAHPGFCLRSSCHPFASCNAWSLYFESVPGHRRILDLDGTSVTVAQADERSALLTRFAKVANGTNCSGVSVQLHAGEKLSHPGCRRGTLRGRPFVPEGDVLQAARRGDDTNFALAAAVASRGAQRPGGEFTKGGGAAAGLLQIPSLLARVVQNLL